jgi:hypothetical protein
MNEPYPGYSLPLHNDAPIHYIRELEAKVTAYELWLIDAEEHLSDLGSIKDRISEGIKFVECQEVAGDIDSWQSEHYNILKGKSPSTPVANEELKK